MRKSTGEITIVSVCVLMLSAPARANEVPASQPGWATPESLARMCDLKIRALMPMLVEAYELTPAEQGQVGRLLERLKAEQIEWTVQTARQRMELGRRAMSQLHAASGKGSPSTLPADFWAAREGLQGLNARSTLLTPEARGALPAVEALLPEQRAQTGRARFEELITRKHAAIDIMVDKAVAAGAEDGWKKFVERFCALYSLDDGQRGTAFSVLRDGLQQRAIMQRNFERSSDRRPRGKEIRQQTAALWEDMCERLDPIPTSPQVLRVLSRAGPNVTATRPTDYVFEKDLLAHASAPAAPAR